MAKLDPKPYPLKAPEGWSPEAIRAQMDEVEALVRATADLPENEIVGGVIKFHVADGYAMYMVTKASPLTIQHIAYSDEYAISAAHIRGLRRADIEAMVAREKAVQAIFSKKRI